MFKIPSRGNYRSVDLMTQSSIKRVKRDALQPYVLIYSNFRMRVTGSMTLVITKKKQKNCIKGGRVPK